MGPARALPDLHCLSIGPFFRALAGLLYRTGGGSRIRTYEARRAADLQSAAINHSAIPPQDASRCDAGCVAMEPRRGLEPLTYRLQIGCAASCATRARVKCPRRDSTQKRSAGADQVLSMRPPLSNGNNAHGGVASDNLSLQDNHLRRALLSLKDRKGGPNGPPFFNPEMPIVSGVCTRPQQPRRCLCRPGIRSPSRSSSRSPRR
jgi:hypothetical protein